MTETKLPGMVINKIDKKSTYDSLVEKGEIGENDLCLVEDEDNISPGSGTDISLGVTGASVGDIIKVKAVDASGKPTAWEAAQMPSGDNWELLYDVTLTEDVKEYVHVFSEPMRKLSVIIDTLAADADTNYSGFSLTFKGATQNSYYPTINPIYPLAIPRKNVCRSVYDISTYYQGETPVCEIHTSLQSGSNSIHEASKTFVYDSVTDIYVHDMMLPQIIKFQQGTYGTFAAGTRYRIWGVKA